MSSTYSRKLRIFGSFVAAALLVACSAHGSPGTLPPVNPLQAQTSSRTFRFTHGAQRFKVPHGVTQLTIAAYGAQGGGYKKSSQGPPGALGAEVTATVSVNSGQLLFVTVGGRGIKGGTNGGGGGFDGGGGAFVGAYGGGGSSDVRAGGDRRTNRIIVAAGGGGSGESGSEFSCEGSSCSGSGSSIPLFGGAGGTGGWGGGQGGSGDRGGGGGGGGTQESGGAGGPGQSGLSVSFSSRYSCAAVNGRKGEFFSAGQGATPACGPAGGGGGGGYFGGGGGGGGGYDDSVATGSIFYESGGGGGGGGGSSFVEKSATHAHRKAGGGPPGDGLVVIKW